MLKFNKQYDNATLTENRKLIYFIFRKSIKRQAGKSLFHEFFKRKRLKSCFQESSLFIITN